MFTIYLYVMVAYFQTAVLYFYAEATHTNPEHGARRRERGERARGLYRFFLMGSIEFTFTAILIQAAGSMPGEFAMRCGLALTIFSTAFIHSALAGYRMLSLVFGISAFTILHLLSLLAFGLAIADY